MGECVELVIKPWLAHALVLRAAPNPCIHVPDCMVAVPTHMVRLPGSRMYAL